MYLRQYKQPQVISFLFCFEDLDNRITYDVYSGWRSKKSGYESLVEVATMASRNYNQIKQREVIIQALGRAFPAPILSLVNFIHSISFTILLTFNVFMI